MSGKYLTKPNLPVGRDISRRLFGDMKEVLFDEDAAKNRESEIVYTVFRNIETVEGMARYDVTEIPARSIGGNAGKEFNKTFGHYHKKNLPELYEVLEGHAYFLLQKPGKDASEITETYIIEALEGEKAVIPPQFGHLAINIGKSVLVLANWIGLTDYDYETVKKMHGGCYYVLDSGASIEFEKNKNYAAVPELKKIKLKNSPELADLGIKNGKDHPILDLKNRPEKLDWLSNPEKHNELLTIQKLYREL